MAIVYDFSNSDNWRLSWSGVKVAPDAPNETLNKYFPIEDFAIPVQFQSPVIAIYIISDTDPERWVRAGYAKQKIQTGITGGGTPDGYTESIPLRLREINLLRFPQIVTNYAVVLSVPFWLRHVDITTWEYVGIITDTVEEKLIECCDDLDKDIAQIRQDLALSTTTILNKLNSLDGDENNDSPDGLSGQEQQVQAYFLGIL